MTELTNENFFTVLDTLGKEIKKLKDTEKCNESYIKYLKGKLEEAEKSPSAEQEAKVQEQAEYIENREAKIADLEEQIYYLKERLAIKTESDAPCPAWDIEPKPKEVAEITSVTNVSKVIIEEDVE